MKKLFIGCLVFTSLQLHAQKKLATPQNKLAGIDTSLQNLLKDFNCAGFAVAVVEKNKVIYIKGFGFKDFENKLPVTPNTVFAIGSCTKAFTTTLMGHLEQDEKVDFEKPVKNYLPALEFYNNDMNNQITLRDMMSHQTGLPRHDYSWYLFSSKSRDSLLARIKYQEPTYGIRQKWQYNNFMFLAQGVIAEKFYGKSWETLVKQRILDSLDMNNTVFTNEQQSKLADYSFGYGVEKDSIIKKLPFYNIDAFGPAGSIKSSVTDMSKWLMTWINGGKYNGKQIFSPSFYAQATSSHAIVRAGLPTKEISDVLFGNYGFGWSLTSYKGHYRVDHGGNIDGFSANTCFFPSDSIGIVVLSNQDGSPVNTIARNIIADKLLGLPYFNWSASRKEEIKKAKKAISDAKPSTTSNQKANTKPTHALQDFEGIYSNQGYGSFEIFLNRDSLFASFPSGKHLWLKHYHYNIFETFDFEDNKIDTTQKTPLNVQFTMNDAGDINALQLPVEASLPNPLLFTRKLKTKEVAVNDLQKYVGDYDLTGVTVKVYIKDSKTLYVLVPGQPDYELNNVGKDKFALKVADGFYVQFDVTDASKCTGLTFLQPNGNFKASKK
jgi:CubicO group peptidase (beta-lactamase class C family)